MKGYKATDKNMQCRGFRFDLNVWYEIPKETPLITCESGFHFCEQPSGVWSYYSEKGTRVFEIEADDVLDVPFEPGASFKRVCRRIRFIREVEIDGNHNTGYGNTGDRNTGHDNTGHRNTGYGNTGHDNTGHRNTGDRNTGDRNTGDCNTGDCNTGHDNTGHDNTGYGNCCDFSSGFFCCEEPPVILFDLPTKIKRKDLPMGLIYELSQVIVSDKDIDYDKYLKIPNATPERIVALQKKHLEKRRIEK